MQKRRRDSEHMYSTPQLLSLSLLSRHRRAAAAERLAYVEPPEEGCSQQHSPARRERVSAVVSITQRHPLHSRNLLELCPIFSLGATLPLTGHLSRDKEELLV
jgi:hypothetical protein